MGILEIFRRTQAKDEQEVALQEQMPIEEEKIAIAPAPEQPKENIEISLPDLDGFYEFIRDRLPREKLDLLLSKTSIGDSEFGSEETTLSVEKGTTRGGYSGYGGSSGEDYIEFSFTSTFVLSTDKRQRDNGYFKKEKQYSIWDAGRIAGIPWGNIPWGNYEQSTRLGPYNKEGAIEGRIEGWKSKNPEPSEAALSKREYQKAMGSYQNKFQSFIETIGEPRNERIWITAEARVKTGDLWHKTPLSQQVLTDVFQRYAKFLKSTLEAVYRVDGLSSPNLQIKFKIPEISVKEPQKEVVPVKSEAHASLDKIKKIPKGLHAECTYCGSNYYTAESFECPGCGAAVPHFIN